MITTRRDFVSLATAGIIVGSAGLSVAMSAEADPPDGSTIVLVRHAEKKARIDGQNDDDVELTDTGKKRAASLVETLGKAGLSAIVTTNAVRSRDTAKPIADALGLKAIKIERNAEERSAVKAAVRAHLPGVVLVVGHSETIPDYLEHFGGPKNVEVNSFDNLFIVVGAKGTTQFIHARYGAV